MVLIFLAGAGSPLRAQPTGLIPECGRYKSATRTLAARPAVADLREEDYDVSYVKLDLALDNLSTQVTGSALTRARVSASGMATYVFELLEDYTIDSLRVNGTLLPYTTSGYVRAVALPAPLPAGTPFEVLVYYHGEPSFGSGFFTTGIRSQSASSWNAQVTYTLSEPYGAKDWWPCKQSLQDKIDSSDVWITVPSGLKAGSNGLLEQVTPLPGGYRRYEWKSRNLIDYYLISVAVGPYVDYSYYMHFDGSQDSMLVQNYVYDDPGALPFYKEEIDSTALMLNYFSALFGRYPFWKEKYGHCITPLGGGMEHQTMTTINHFGASLVAHELGHQWFGDHVTCATWSDIWLNEGFATYLDYLYRYHSRGDSAGAAMMADLHAQVMSDPGGSVYCTDTTDVGRIFSSRLSYSKGAAIIHTLRFLYDDDDRFFAMLHNYLDLFGGETASTTQFRTVAAAGYGYSLNTFFDQWVYGEGFPIYTASWNQVSDQVIVRLEQTTSAPSSVPFFHTPLEIKLYGEGRDTVVRVTQSTPAEIFSFSWSAAVDSIALDPDNDILNRTDSIRRDFSLLSIEGFDTTLFLLYPNPASAYWILEGMPQHCDITVSDISGKLVWKGANGTRNAVQIYNHTFARGIYLLRVYARNGKHKVVKLIKN